MTDRPTMPREELEDVGRAIYGPQWVTPLARDLRDMTGGPADRTAQRWASGANPIPAGLRDDLRALIDAKVNTLRAARRRIGKAAKGG